jgi:putative peptidoglycan lipid II flippase
MIASNRPPGSEPHRSPDTETPATSVKAVDQVGPASLKMAAGTLTSRITGQVRSIMLVLALGATGLAANSFDIANNIPNTLFIIISGGLLNAILIPQIIVLYQRNNPQAKINALLTFSGTLILAVTVILTLLAPQLVSLYAGVDWTAEELGLATSFAYLCLPQIFFYGIYTLLGQVLAAQAKFTAYFFAPVINNIIASLSLGAFVLVYGSRAVNGLDWIGAWDQTKIFWLGLSATGGIVAQALCLVVLLAKSCFRFRFTFTLHGFGLRAMLRVALWSLGLVLLEELSALVVFKVVANAPVENDSVMSDLIAGNAALNQATLIYLVPYSLVTVSIATAIFTRMSQAFADRQPQRAIAAYTSGICSTAIFSLFASALVGVLGIALTQLLIPSLEIYAIGVVGWIVRFQALGYLGLSITLLSKRFYFACRAPRWAFLLNLPITILQIGGVWVISWWASSQHVAEWLVLWLVISYAIASAIYLFDINRRFPAQLNLLKIFRTLAKSTVGFVVSGGFGLFLTWVWPIEAAANYFVIAGQTIVVAILMALVYYLVLRVLKVDQLDYYLNHLLRPLKLIKERFSNFGERVE